MFVSVFVAVFVLCLCLCSYVSVNSFELLDASSGAAYLDVPASNRLVTAAREEDTLAADATQSVVTGCTPQPSTTGTHRRG